MLSRQRSPFATFMVVASLVFLFVPLLVVVVFSFHSEGALTLPFRGFSLRWYRQIWESDEFRTSLINSALVAGVTGAVTLVLGTLAAYALSAARSRLRAPLALILFLPLTLPGLFVGLALLVMFGRMNVSLSLWTVAVGHLVYVMPYFLLIAVATLQRLDVALEEAAADLGATRWVVFTRVTLPQVWPVLMGATFLAFALSFDEFVITFFVIGPESTLPLYIFSSLRRTVDPSINAISTLLLGITLVLFSLSFALTTRGGRSPALAVPVEGGRRD